MMSRCVQLLAERYAIATAAAAGGEISTSTALRGRRLDFRRQMEHGTVQFPVISTLTDPNAVLKLWFQVFLEVGRQRSI
jgi:hypothetical protein